MDYLGSQRTSLRRHLAQKAIKRCTQGSSLIRRGKLVEQRVQILGALNVPQEMPSRRRMVKRQQCAVELRGAHSDVPSKLTRGSRRPHHDALEKCRDSYGASDKGAAIDHDVDIAAATANDSLRSNI